MRFCGGVNGELALFVCPYSTLFDWALNKKCLELGGRKWFRLVVTKVAISRDIRLQSAEAFGYI